MEARVGIGHLSCTIWLKMTGFLALINCNWTYPFTASAYRLVSILVSVSSRWSRREHLDQLSGLRGTHQKGRGPNRNCGIRRLWRLLSIRRRCSRRVAAKMKDETSGARSIAARRLGSSEVGRGQHTACTTPGTGRGFASAPLPGLWGTGGPKYAIHGTDLRGAIAGVGGVWCCGVEMRAA